VYGEALGTAREIGHAGEQAEALATVAKRLSAEEALAVVRGIDDAKGRARALMAVAARLPPDHQPGVFGEALSAARRIEVHSWRAEALATVAERLPPEDQPGAFGEALRAALGTVKGYSDRPEALAAVAQRLSSAQISMPLVHQWVETARALAMGRRSDCISDFVAFLPFIHAVAGEDALRGLGRSIASVGAWWP
jgi:hypothetical protein